MLTGVKTTTICQLCAGVAKQNCRRFADVERAQLIRRMSASGWPDWALTLLATFRRKNGLILVTMANARAKQIPPESVRRDAAMVV
jgi:hypothetical protein